MGGGNSHQRKAGRKERERIKAEISGKVLDKITGASATIPESWQTLRNGANHTKSSAKTLELATEKSAATVTHVFPLWFFSKLWESDLVLWFVAALWVFAGGAIAMQSNNDYEIAGISFAIGDILLLAKFVVWASVAEKPKQQRIAALALGLCLSTPLVVGQAWYVLWRLRPVFVYLSPLGFDSSSGEWVFQIMPSYRPATTVTFDMVDQMSALGRSSRAFTKHGPYPEIAAGQMSLMIRTKPLDPDGGYQSYTIALWSHEGGSYVEDLTIVGKTTERNQYKIVITDDQYKKTFYECVDHSPSFPPRNVPECWHIEGKH